jgi:hypothetical protein
MVSSRCNDNFPAGENGQLLSEIRRELKKEIEHLKVFGKKMFEVWINEETPPQGGDWNSMEVCLRAVDDCDILLVLYNGNAGWAEKSGGIGICHAEMERGLNRAPGKVRAIDISDAETCKKLRKKEERHARFQDYFNTQSPFRGDDVKTVEDLKARVKEALYGAVIALAQAGVRESSRGAKGYGDPLFWSRLDFAGREQEMVLKLQDAMREYGYLQPDGNVVARIGTADILLVPHAIPAAFSIGPAKEMVGQPFLRDHELAESLTEEINGPLHVIACYKSATEMQAIKLLGFPDATVVTTIFGVFVADNIQKVQFAFIANCYDETNTRYGVQRFFGWLAQSGEDRYVAERARSRSRIVHAIAKEAALFDTAIAYQGFRLGLDGDSTTDAPSPKKKRK